jgi:hypothetical protein
MTIAVNSEPEPVAEKTTPFFSFDVLIRKTALSFHFISFRKSGNRSLGKNSPHRVARFFLAQHTKTRKKFQITIKYKERPQNIPNGRKIDQMAIKYTNIFHRKSFQNLPKLGFLV